MSALLNAGLAFVFLLARKYDESIKQALTAIDVDPNMTLPHMVLGVAYSQTGQNVAAIESYERGIALRRDVRAPKSFYRQCAWQVGGLGEGVEDSG